jgi:hypothetical protein
MINVAVIAQSLNVRVARAVQKCGYLVCHLHDSFAQVRSGTIVDLLATEAVSRLVKLKPGFQLIPEGAKAIDVPDDAHDLSLLCRGRPIAAI